MIIAHDLYAEANPAFGTFAILGFCRNYIETSQEHPLFILPYLALPIAFSDDLAHSFEETRATTGLLSWLNRYPSIRLNLGDRLDSSKEVVSSAIRFGISTRALALGMHGTIILGSRVPKLKAITALPEDSRKIIKRAERLGTWMGKAGSASSIYSVFGVTP
jgi:hypothetical protein